MRTLNLLLLASLLLVTNLSTSQEPPELAEAATLTNSVLKLYDAEKYDEALPLAKRALQIREKSLPRTDQRVSDAWTNLAEIYIGKLDYDAARKAFERVIDLQEEANGPENPRIAAALDRLAPLYFRTGNYSKAENAYKRALAVREKSLGTDNVQVARSLFALAEFYRVRREFQSALENYQRALRLYKKLSSTNTPEFVRAREGYSCLSYAKPDLTAEIQALWKEFVDPEQDSPPEPGKVLNGRALSLPKPDYPPAARQLRLAGQVVVLVLIDETGKVISARDMCQGPLYLSEASVAAALNARFSPTKLSGMPVKVNGIIQYNFVAR
jgi:TonB family protein